MHPSGLICQFVPPKGKNRRIREHYSPFMLPAILLAFNVTLLSGHFNNRLLNHHPAGTVASADGACPARRTRRALPASFLLRFLGLLTRLSLSPGKLPCCHVLTESLWICSDLHPHWWTSPNPCILAVLLPFLLLRRVYKVSLGKWCC